MNRRERDESAGCRPADEAALIVSMNEADDRNRVVIKGAGEAAAHARRLPQQRGCVVHLIRHSFNGCCPS